MAIFNFQYYAIIEKDIDGFNVSFPDLKGCFSCGETLSEAVEMAHEALEVHLEVLTTEPDSLPLDLPYPSDPNKIKIPHNASLVAIEIELDEDSINGMMLYGKGENDEPIFHLKEHPRKRMRDKMRNRHKTKSESSNNVNA